MQSHEWLGLWSEMRAVWPARGGDADERRCTAYFKRLRGYPEQHVRRSVENHIAGGRGFPEMSDILKPLSEYAASEQKPADRTTFTATQMDQIKAVTADMRSKGWHEVTGTILMDFDTHRIIGYRQRFVLHEPTGSRHTEVQTIFKRQLTRDTATT